MSVTELIRIENRGRSSELYVAGLRVGRGLYGLSFNQPENDMSNPKLTVTIDIKETLKALSEIPTEHFEQAKEIMKDYLSGYKRTVTDDGNSSMEILR